MRERLKINKIFKAIYRITPAYAGKTERKGIAPPRRRDHPRVCGKDF